MRAGEADKNNPPHSWERGGLDGILSPPYVIRGRKGMQWHTKLNRLQGASFSFRYNGHDSDAWSSSSQPGEYLDTSGVHYVVNRRLSTYYRDPLDSFVRSCFKASLCGKQTGANNGPDLTEWKSSTEINNELQFRHKPAKVL